MISAFDLNRGVYLYIYTVLNVRAPVSYGFKLDMHAEKALFDLDNTKCQLFYDYVNFSVSYWNVLPLILTSKVNITL